MYRRKLELHESEIDLLTSLEGAAAFSLLLPLLRELAMHIAGVAPCPPIIEQLPDLKADVALERARFRNLTKRRRPDERG